jgi:copper chaperone NosL
MKCLYRQAFVVLVTALTWACGEKQSVDVPAPQELNRDAVGYFCQMMVLNHDGPKGQIFLTDRQQPLWFTSVRDTIAFTVLPGEAKNIAAIYVTDVGSASWDQPEPGTWVDARQAFYVVGSDRVGGMQVPEVVPFASREGAKLFMQKHGGGIFVFDEIPRESLIEEVE